MNQSTRAAALVRAAHAELEQNIAPDLAGRQRYSAAMLRRALEVMLREQEQHSSAGSDKALLASAYGADTSDTSDFVTLARDIRARRIEHTSELAQALMTFVHNKLKISNPDFLTIASEQINPDRGSELAGDNQ